MSCFLAYKKKISSKNYLNQNIDLSKKKKRKKRRGPQAVWSWIWATRGPGGRGTLKKKRGRDIFKIKFF